MKALIIFLSLLAIPFSYAASLKGGIGVEILAVDGQEVENSFLSSQNLEISDGVHQVVVQYSSNFKKGDLVESKPYLFNIEVKGDTEVSTRLFRNQKQAEDSINAGLVWFVKNDLTVQKIVDAEALTAKGYLPYSDIEKLVTAYNQKHGISSAAVVSVAVPETQKVAKPETLNAVQLSVATQQTKTEQLMQIYNGATKQERKAFRMWLLEQDLK